MNNKTLNKKPRTLNAIKVISLTAILLLSFNLYASTKNTRGRGQVIGLSAPDSNPNKFRTNGVSRVLALAPSASCIVYYDVTGELTFNPPASNTVITPNIIQNKVNCAEVASCGY